jgi:hypothetical protein
MFEVEFSYSFYYIITSNLMNNLTIIEIFYIFHRQCISIESYMIKIRIYLFKVNIYIFYTNKKVF